MFKNRIISVLVIALAVLAGTTVTPSAAKAEAPLAGMSYSMIKLSSGAVCGSDACAWITRTGTQTPWVVLTGVNRNYTGSCKYNFSANVVTCYPNGFSFNANAYTSHWAGSTGGLVAAYGRQHCPSGGYRFSTAKYWTIPGRDFPLDWGTFILGTFCRATF